MENRETAFEKIKCKPNINNIGYSRYLLHREQGQGGVQESQSCAKCETQKADEYHFWDFQQLEKGVPRWLCICATQKGRVYINTLDVLPSHV